MHQCRQPNLPWHQHPTSDMQDLQPPTSADPHLLPGCTENCTGETVTIHAHWLSHTLTQHLVRQVQQQRWQLPGRRTACWPWSPLHLWADCGWDLGRFQCISSPPPGCTSYLLQRISVLVQCFNAVLLHDSLPAADCTDWRIHLCIA